MNALIRRMVLIWKWFSPVHSISEGKGNPWIIWLRCRSFSMRFHVWIKLRSESTYLDVYVQHICNYFNLDSLDRSRLNCCERYQDVIDVSGLYLDRWHNLPFISFNLLAWFLSHEPFTTSTLTCSLQTTATISIMQEHWSKLLNW